MCCFHYLTLQVKSTVGIIGSSGREWEMLQNALFSLIRITILKFHKCSYIYGAVLRTLKKTSDYSHSLRPCLKGGCFNAGVIPTTYGLLVLTSKRRTPRATAMNRDITYFFSFLRYSNADYFRSDSLYLLERKFLVT